MVFTFAHWIFTVDVMLAGRYALMVCRLRFIVCAAFCWFSMSVRVAASLLRASRPSAPLPA